MWSKKIVELLIAKYKEHDNLYDVAHPQYLDRVRRSISIYAICKELKKLDPSIDEEMVKKKIGALRTQYVKVRRNMIKSKENNIGDDDNEPQLWYFSHLDFLHPFISLKRSHVPQSVLESRKREAVEDYEMISDDTNMLADECTNFLKENDNMAYDVVDAFEESGNDLSVLAQAWNSQYAQLSNQQREYARKIISDVFFNGRLERIKATTVEGIHNVLESYEECDE